VKLKPRNGKPPKRYQNTSDTKISSDSLEELAKESLQIGKLLGLEVTRKAKVAKHSITKTSKRYRRTEVTSNKQETK